MTFCSCNATIRNTGKPSKQRVINSGVKLIAVRMKADDGTVNGILPTDNINQAYLDAKINNADASKRWYPLGEFKQQEDVRGDSVFESFSDGSNSKTQDGIRSYTGWLINYAAAYLEILESFSCSSFGVFTIDSCGGITGSLSPDGTILRPIRVNQDSWNPTLVKGTPTESGKVQLNFEFSQLEKDKYLRVINDAEITADILDAEGLLNVSGEFSSVTTTGFTVALTVDYDLFLDASQQVVPAWVLADFVLTNVTTNSVVAITSVTETTQGTYDFVFPAQLSSDVLKLSNDLAVKQGFSLEETVNIP